MTNRTLVFGCGHLGRQVAELAIEAGDTVYATTRDDTKRSSLENSGVQPLTCDWNDPRTLRCLPSVDRVLVAVAYDPRGGVDRHTAMVGGLSHLLIALQKTQNGGVPDLCYLSTTGVYHQTGGVWVDEASPTQPRREGGKAHLRAESLLHRRLGNQGYQILRLAGLYGPGRVPRVADVVDVVAGRPIASPAEGYLNLIHVADAAATVMAAWKSLALSSDTSASTGHPRRHTYVVSDDQPVVRRDFYRHIARQWNAGEPTFIDPVKVFTDPAKAFNPAKDSSRRFRSETNKRVWNRRMKRELGVTLTYPSYREGLADVLDCSTMPPSC